jgi:hypothetical protein
MLTNDDEKLVKAYRCLYVVLVVSTKITPHPLSAL